MPVLEVIQTGGDAVSGWCLVRVVVIGRCVLGFPGQTSPLRVDVESDSAVIRQSDGALWEVRAGCWAEASV